MQALNQAITGWTLVEKMAGYTVANEDTLTLLMATLNVLDYTDICDLLYQWTNEAYNGLNKECGDWGKGLLNIAMDKRFAE